MIISNWTTFRRRFAVIVEETFAGAATVTFNAATPATITRAAGSFIASGYLAGHRVSPMGTTSNDGGYVIDTVAAGTLTLASGETLVAEGPVNCDLESGFVDKDEVYQWPISLVRAAGFDGGLLSLTTPPPGSTLAASCNGGAADSTPTVDEYDWYLSQRTDDPASQWLTVEPVTAGANTYSGSVVVTMTAAAISKFGTPVSADELPALLKNAHLYCRRISDGAIQWVDVYRYVVGL